MAATRLSERQAQILGFFRDYAAQHQTPPTIREVADHIGVKTASGAQGHLRALVSKGYLSHTPNISRGYRLGEEGQRPAEPADAGSVRAPDVDAANDSRRRETLTLIPLVGRVPGGPPSTQEMEELGYLQLPIHVSAGSFALRVVGDSMRDAHILDGDLAVVDPSLEARDRSVVLAFVDGAYTLKALRITDKGWWLEPANERHSPIIPSLDEDRVHAPVVALVRTQIQRRPRATSWSQSD